MIHKPLFYNENFWSSWSRRLVRLAVGMGISARFFYSSQEVFPRPYVGRLHLELVSHCWKYSHLLRLQLSSVIENLPANADLTMTVLFCDEDHETKFLLDEFSNINIPGLKWNFCSIESKLLFRRAIGRNHAATNTSADWIWFTDCDLILGKGALDALVECVQGRTDYLLYPECCGMTRLLENQDIRGMNSVSDFKPENIIQVRERRATGPLQIVHGDVARAYGYCREVDCFLTPASRWQKCFEDSVFRWLMGVNGTPIPVPGVWRIGHIEKGRYQEGAYLSRLRMMLRKAKKIR